MAPHSLVERIVLDAGAGTGLASRALLAAGAQVIATDLSRDMLEWEAPSRPPAVVADIRALPFVSACVDDVVAAFVLNHLTDPGAAIAELVRVCRPGGALLASVLSNDSRSAVRDRIDELAREAGFEVPRWYTEIKAAAAPLLGSAVAMGAALDEAGVGEVMVEERAVDVGITAAGDLVAYRFGQPHYAAWLDSLGEERARDVAARIAAAIAPLMKPYRPIVVFACGRAG